MVMVVSILKVKVQSMCTRHVGDNRTISLHTVVEEWNIELEEQDRDTFIRSESGSGSGSMKRLLSHPWSRV